MKKPEIKITQPKAVHIIAWLNPKINYRIVGKNGETLLFCNQGFESEAGLIKNIRAVARIFLIEHASGWGVTIYWTTNRNTKTIVRQTMVTV